MPLTPHHLLSLWIPVCVSNDVNINIMTHKQHCTEFCVCMGHHMAICMVALFNNNLDRLCTCASESARLLTGSASQVKTEELVAVRWTEPWSWNDVILQIHIVSVITDACFCAAGKQRILQFLCFLWPPYGIGQPIIFSRCGFYLSSIFFFPRLISAVGDWISTILPHMVWP